MLTCLSSMNHHWPRNRNTLDHFTSWAQNMLLHNHLWSGIYIKEIFFSKSALKHLWKIQTILTSCCVHPFSINRLIEVNNQPCRYAHKLHKRIHITIALVGMLDHVIKHACSSATNKKLWAINCKLSTMPGTVVKTWATACHYTSSLATFVPLVAEEAPCCWASPCQDKLGRPAFHDLNHHV